MAQAFVLSILIIQFSLNEKNCTPKGQQNKSFIQYRVDRETGIYLREKMFSSIVPNKNHLQRKTVLVEAGIPSVPDSIVKIIE